MPARVRGELGVERGGEQRALAHGNYHVPGCFGMRKAHGRHVHVARKIKEDTGGDVATQHKQFSIFLKKIQTKKQRCANLGACRLKSFTNPPSPAGVASRAEGGGGGAAAVATAAAALALRTAKAATEGRALTLASTRTPAPTFTIAGARINTALDAGA